VVGENPAAAAIMGEKDVPTGDGACVRTRQSAPCALSAKRRAEHRIEWSEVPATADAKLAGETIVVTKARIPLVLTPCVIDLTQEE
jgi:hypothetical protein